jgi:hypothetical protein
MRLIYFIMKEFIIIDIFILWFIIIIMVFHYFNNIFL